MNGIKEVLDIVTVVSYYGYWLMDHNVDQQSKTNLGYKCTLYLDNTGRCHQWKKSSIQLIWSFFNRLQEILKPAN